MTIMSDDDSHFEEAELIERAQRGSHAAFGDLVRLHQGAVRAYLSRWLPNADEIDDMAQEVFLAAYRSLDTFDHSARLRSWLLGIARHRALTWVRDRGRRCRHENRMVDASLATAAATAIEEERAEGDEHARLVAMQDCLGGLSSQHCRLLSRRYVNGASFGQLAEETGKTATALRVALHRLRQTLRKCIDGKLLEKPA